MKRNILTGFLAVLMLIIFAGNITFTVFAQNSQPNEGKNSRKKKGFMDRMKLSDEQKKKIMGIRQKYSGKLEDISFSVLEARVDLAKELRKEEPSRENISKIITKISQLEEKKMRIIMDEFFEVRKILTPEQKKYYMRKFIRQITRSSSKIRH